MFFLSSLSGKKQAIYSLKDLKLTLLFLSCSALTCISQTLILLYHNDNNY